MSTHYRLDIPITPTDLVNRRAAATGSVGYAQATSYAEYNGHYVTVSFKSHSVYGPCWNAEYFWGERVVLRRGSFTACLEAALAEHKRGARGTSINVYPTTAAPEHFWEQAEACEAAGLQAVADPQAKSPWWTSTHEAVLDALHWEDSGFRGIITEALQFTGPIAEWPGRREAWLATRRKEVVR